MGQVSGMGAIGTVRPQNRSSILDGHCWICNREREIEASHLHTGISLESDVHNAISCCHRSQRGSEARVAAVEGAHVEVAGDIFERPELILSPDVRHLSSTSLRSIRPQVCIVNLEPIIALLERHFVEI